MRPPKGLFAATALTKVMSGDMTSGIKLKVGHPGYDPHTNTLSLPGIPAGDIPDATLDRLLAYLGHEAAERGISTWDPQDRRWRSKPGLRHLVNGINDARIDLIQSDRYPGCGMKIRAVRTEHLKKLVKRYREQAKLECTVKTIACLAVYVGEGIISVDKLYKLFPRWAKFFKRVDRQLRNLDLSSEQACIEQAMAMYDRLKEPEPDEPEPDNAKAEQQTEQGNQGETRDPMDEGEDADDVDLDEDSQGSGESDPDESLDDDVEGGTGTGDKDDDSEEEAGDEGASGGSTAAEGGDAGETDGNGADESDAETDDTDSDDSTGDDESEPEDVQRPGPQKPNDQLKPSKPKGDIPGPGKHIENTVLDDGEELDDEGADDGDVQDDLLNQIVQEIFNGEDKSDSPFAKDYYSNQTTSYTYDPTHDEVRVAKEHHYEVGREAYAKAAQVLETKMRQVMTAPALRPVRNRDRGELDERAIGRMVAGDENTFQRRMRIEAESVACAVSWDESYSMNSGRIDVVRDLALTWNEALGKLKIPFGLYGWTTSGYSGVGNAQVYRQERIRHLTYKEFHERWNDTKVLRRLAGIHASGSTPTGEGLLYAADKIGRRPEARRIIFFLTDGRPALAVNGPADVHFDFIRSLLLRCDRAGIEVVGVGINADLGHLFPHWLRIDNVADLIGTCSDELLRILRTTRKAV